MFSGGKCDFFQVGLLLAKKLFKDKLCMLKNVSLQGWTKAPSFLYADACVDSEANCV